MGGGTLLVNASHFEQNFADGSGGCFYVDASAKFTSEFNTHHGSESKGAGAALYAALVSRIYIRDSAYEHGDSHTDGGAVFIDYASEVIFERTLFKHNSAKNGGGARLERTRASPLVSMRPFSDGLVFRPQLHSFHSDDRERLLV